MTKLPLLAAAVALAIPLLAAAATTGIVLDNGVPSAFLQLPTRPYTPPLAHKSRSPVVFENFATLYPKGEYNAVEGASVSAVHTLHGQIWLAAAFTPRTHATITEIDVGAAFIGGGENVVAVHLYEDAGGVPGRQLWTLNTPLPPFSVCCSIAALGANVPVQGGKQYWVGITTLGGPGSTVSAAWNLAVKDQFTSVPVAQNRGDGWVAGSEAPGFAFGVYGQ